MNIPAPFTQNQLDYLRRSSVSWFNVAEGGKRGGKNVLQTLAFCIQLEVHPDKLHLIAGVSQTTAKLNILDCDGYGLMNFFEGRCREGKYKDRACLYIETQTGEKVVLVSGGGKSGDEKYIKGNTYGMAYITEANECHEKFVREVFDRTMSSSNRKVFHDLNPKAPGHWYYAEVLDFHQKKQDASADYGYNYGHFTIADNMSVSDEKLRKVLSTYQKGTVWYDRDVLGLRKVAEGLVYRAFAQNPEKYLVDDAKKWMRANQKRVLTVMIGVDFGGTGSATKFQATLITDDYCVIAADEEHIKTELDPQELNVRFARFVKKVQAEFGGSQTRADSAEQILIRGLMHTVQKEGLKTQVKNARKMEIKERIRLTCLLMAQGRFFVSRKCPHLIDALQSAMYDPKEVNDVRLDDGTTDIDSLDALEYSIEPHFKNLEAAFYRKRG